MHIAQGTQIGWFQLHYVIVCIDFGINIIFMKCKMGSRLHCIQVIHT